VGGSELITPLLGDLMMASSPASVGPLHSLPWLSRLSKADSLLLQIS